MIKLQVPGEWQVTGDMVHWTYDMWLMTCDIWHMKYDMWHMNFSFIFFVIGASICTSWEIQFQCQCIFGKVLWHLKIFYAFLDTFIVFQNFFGKYFPHKFRELIPLILFTTLLEGIRIHSVKVVSWSLPQVCELGISKSQSPNCWHQAETNKTRLGLCKKGNWGLYSF